MSRNLAPIDISSVPELIGFAEEVVRTKTPRALMRDKKPLAVLMPVSINAKSRKKRAKTKADYEAFRKAAGSLKGLIDAEKLKKDMYESRKIISRPAFEL